MIVIASDNFQHTTLLHRTSACDECHDIFRTGMVLVTDAIPAMGLPLGTIYHNGQQQIEVKNGVAYIAGTDTMCGRFVSSFGNHG